MAKEYRAREEMYKNELPDDQAEIKMTALTMEGNVEMCALATATTNGEDFAPAPPEVKRSSSLGQVTPMAKIART
jgi:hypothetical protein